MKRTRISLWLLFFLLTVIVQACGSPDRPDTAAIEPAAQGQPSTAEPVTVSTPTAEVVVADTPTLEVTPSQTAPLVMVTAVGGELSIRTGPDTSFDAIARLEDGETATALARSIMDGWLQIEIPSQPGTTGWVSIKTEYSLVDGYVLDLPRIDIVEWNFGSYLRNCTSHQLLVQPGDKVLEPVSQSSEKGVWFTPGLYSIYDLDVSGQPLVTRIKVYEHSQYNIRKDGDRQAWDCPK